MRGDVVRLHHEGLSVAQIAERMGLDINSVWEIQHRAGIARVKHRTAASMKGENLADPKRADKALRRFSWEDA